MKIRFWYVLPGILLFLTATLGSWKDIQKETGIPDDVEKILSNSCYACHVTGAKPKFAVKALDFKIWNEYKAPKKVGLLNNIKEVVTKDKMPPSRFLKKNPDKALSEENKKMIVDWTKKETEKLMK